MLYVSGICNSNYYKKTGSAALFSWLAGLERGHTCRRRQ